MEKASWTIYWNEYSSDTYLYGSQIDYKAKNYVHTGVVLPDQLSGSAY